MSAVLNSLFNIVPLLLIILFLFDVRITFSRLFFVLFGIANLVGALLLGLNGWNFESMSAWSLMLWLIVLLGHKFGVDVSARVYLAFFSILPSTVLWEVSWIAIHSSLLLGYFTLCGGSRLVCLPFLFWELKRLGWHFKNYMLLLTMLYLVWMLILPFLSWPIVVWFVRLPTVAFCVMVIFGGLMKRIED